jgi:hypothetical protein
LKSTSTITSNIGWEYLLIQDQNLSTCIPGDETKYLVDTIHSCGIQSAFEKHVTWWQRTTYLSNDNTSLELSQKHHLLFNQTRSLKMHFTPTNPSTVGLPQQNPAAYRELRSTFQNRTPPPSAQSIFSTIIHVIPTITAFTEIVYEDIAPEDGDLVTRSLAQSAVVEQHSTR